MERCEADAPRPTRPTRGRRAAAWLAVAAAVLAAAGSRPAGASSAAPGFCVQLTTGATRIYAWPSGGSSVSDQYVEASVASVGPTEWELTLRAKAVGFREVWFPWQPAPYALNSNLEDDVIYSPEMAGVAHKATRQREWGWNGYVYPGDCCAPLVIIADGSKAKLVAATNWPPLRVRPSYSLHRLAMRYDQEQPPETTRKYRALVREFDGDAAAGAPPWHAAIDYYRGWLHDRMAAAGLYPPAYSARMKNAKGWLNWQLQSQPAFDVEYLRQYHARWSPHFPWMQFWGQMSVGEGPPAVVVPPPRPGEEAGCCLGRRRMHERYLPQLPQFIRQIRQQGTMVGLYARPRDPWCNQRLDDPTVTDGETNLQFLLEWLRLNREEYGADVTIVDTLGRCYYGDALFVADLFRTTLSADTVIEGGVDVYPCIYVFSGFLIGGQWGGGPERRIERLGDGYNSMSFPALGRYLLNDRLVFMGGSNNDWTFWGPTKDYWGERQAFLYGAKLDLVHPSESRDSPLGAMNHAVELILAEWQRVGWWAREPTYHDRAGITEVPADVEVRRFRDKDGHNLFVIDNWLRRSGLRFRYGADLIDIPVAQLAVVVRPGS